jgi:purine nucleosidase
MPRPGALLVALLLASAPAIRAQHPARSQQLVLIDTDAGDDIDDAFALAYALRTPDFHILGITTTFGDTPLRAHLVQHLLADAGHSDIPVAAGPRSSGSAFTQTAYAKADTRKLSSQSGVDLILQTAKQHPGQVTLVALGPLNTIGATIDRDPTGFRQLKRVVLMGGSIHRGYDKPDGSRTNGPTPEWNILNNVSAARRLFASGVPIQMMPLDSTQIPLRSPLKDQILSQPTGLSRALAELAREFNKPITLFDALTMAYAGTPSLCPTQPMHISIGDKGETNVTSGPPNADVCLRSEEQAFLASLRKRLTQ